MKDMSIKNQSKSKDKGSKLFIFSDINSTTVSNIVGQYSNESKIIHNVQTNK